MTQSLMLGAFALAALCAPAQAAPRLLAHRGGSLEADENTMAAFRQSYECGLRGFETDIHLTRDGELVIIHDETFDRTTTATGSVEEATAEQVRAIRTKKAGEPLPFLSDVLNYFKDKPGVFIELEMKTKPETYNQARLEVYCRKLHDAVKGVLPDNAYSFTSFDQRALKVMRQIDPNVALTLILGGSMGDAEIRAALDLGCRRISPRMELTTREAVQAAQKAGLEVTGWPAKDEQDFALAIGLGVNCLTTDVPCRLNAVLGQSGGLKTGPNVVDGLKAQP